MLAGLKRLRGFTLIELLIVIAIILILIAIALPNFLEAQIRARVTKASSEIRTLQTATESYRIDWGKDPIAMVPDDPTNWPNQYPPEGTGLSWWGYHSEGLTTPVEYLTALPVDPFYDSIHTPASGLFQTRPGEEPYTFIRDSSVSTWPYGVNLINSPAIQAIVGDGYGTPADYLQRVCHAGYVYYSPGPDTVDGTVNGGPMVYSPTNGTKSYGEIYAFGDGTPFDDIADTAPWGTVTAAERREREVQIRGNCASIP